MAEVEAFAVEDTAIQLSWPSLGPGRVRIAASESVVVVRADGGPGAVTIDGLPPDTTVDVEIVEDGVKTHLDVRTLAPPTGPELCRIATVNDLHIGSSGFGLVKRIREEPPPADPAPLRCARAAVREAVAWGAQILVVKGDLTEESHPENWRAIGDLLARVPVPVEVVPGNHDLGSRGTVAAQSALAAHGLRLVHGVLVRDLPGIRLVIVDTVIPGRSKGRIAHLQDEVARVVGRAAGPVLLAMHHHPQPHRWPRHWPPGIPGPEAARFLDAVATANPATLVTTGHTHRHRRHRHGPLTITEVGSTKDYPGTWTGYAVHAGGIRQVVRRVAAPEAIRWTERTRRAVGGLWAHWSPGTLADRCFTVDWPEGESTGEPSNPLG